MADYQERMYEESINILNFEHHSGVNSLISQNATQVENNINTNKLSELFLSNESKLHLEIYYKNKSTESFINEEKLEILECLKKFNAEFNLCCILTIYYILECIDLNDWINIKLILPIVKFPDNNNNFEKWFISQFISSLCDHIEYLKIDWICKMIFNDFLIKYIKSDISYELVYKLMDKLFNLLPHEVYTTLLDEIKPKKSVSCYF